MRCQRNLLCCQKSLEARRHERGLRLRLWYWLPPTGIQTIGEAPPLAAPVPRQKSPPSVADFQPISTGQATENASTDRKKYLKSHEYSDEILDIETLAYYNGANHHYYLWSDSAKA